MRSARSVAARILPFDIPPVIRMHAVPDLSPDPVGDFDDRHLKVLIESLSRAGCSEREIVRAVEEASRHRA
jgi:hypothetical protein